MRIAIIGSGVSGLSAAWLLSQRHTVSVFEKDDRLGGHANTQSIRLGDDTVDVDTGFIVYNEKTYPNLTALYEHVNIPTNATDMSFSVSMGDGQFEYAGSDLAGLFAQPGNLVNMHFWGMLKDIRRFYARSVEFAEDPASEGVSLGHYLMQEGYSQFFIQRHLLPMGAAIWSMPAEKMLAFPFRSFVRFCKNHGLLQISDRPQWRTVTGGSKNYVSRLARDFTGPTFLNCAIAAVERKPGHVEVIDREGERMAFDHVVFACHSDQALRILRAGESGVTEDEQAILGSLRYQKNLALLHTDEALMPKRKRAWTSWNYLTGDASDDGTSLSVTYWMNRLQTLSTDKDLFVTLNPLKQPREGSVLRSYVYEHPIFDGDALAAQHRLWSLQGRRRAWFCGAYFGHGFHEDGLQAGLAVAEQLGGVRRPWSVADESGRIPLATTSSSGAREAAE
ncbi:NAD(P)/FAD-dependent oxidoreductase [Coralliovum pocilloporae]|uniref:NAD(P)/FAD-dependent oxidoreductase n=1 Tax=Coralliovum pocilloporae TaxID=3066369 RepID=UPI003306F5D4